MGNLLQQFARRCDKCVARCRCWVYILSGICGWWPPRLVMQTVS